MRIRSSGIGRITHLASESTDSLVALYESLSKTFFALLINISASIPAKIDIHIQRNNGNTVGSVIPSSS